PSFVVDITSHIEAKMRALACYRSQFIEGRPTTAPTILDDLRDRARYWGWAIGAGYGEPFVCREEIGLRGLRDLVWFLPLGKPGVWCGLDSRRPGKMFGSCRRAASLTTPPPPSGESYPTGRDDINRRRYRAGTPDDAAKEFAVRRELNVLALIKGTE